MRYYKIFSSVINGSTIKKEKLDDLFEYSHLSFDSKVKKKFHD